MDLQELLTNIGRARDTARADAIRYRELGEQERQSLGGVDGAAAMAGRSSVANTLHIIDVTLSRILGEDAEPAA